jgi:hypothetical protein
MRNLSVILASAAFLAACDAAPAGWLNYADSKVGFSIYYPDGWMLDAQHDYQALGPGKDIHGVAFTVPAALAKGTNLSTDSYVAVESLPSSGGCTADRFLDDAAATPHTIAQNGLTFSVADGQDAGAGNAYEEHIYATQSANACIAIRYFIHSANIANFDPGTVKAFDHAGLIATMDKMRASFRLTR